MEAQAIQPSQRRMTAPELAAKYRGKRELYQYVAPRRSVLTLSALCRQPAQRRRRLLPAHVQDRLHLLDEGPAVLEAKGRQEHGGPDHQRAAVRVAQHQEDARVRRGLLRGRGVLS